MKLSTLHYTLFALLCLLLAGCPRSDSDSKEKEAVRPLASVKLRVAVADDAALAAAIVRVQGEWNAQTGSEFEVIETTQNALQQADGLPADAVVCSSHLLGVLAECDWLAPVPANILRNPEWADVFPLPRLREAAWGNKTMAVPFGSPVFCCYYRADLLEKLGRRPPRTWAEYQDLAKLLAKDSPRPLGERQGVRAWSATIEPLAPGWAGLVLLARAAPYAKHRDNFSTLFNIETMEPMAAGPPMVQALDELVAAAKLGPTDPFKFDPAAVRAAFWRGECGMALTWPTAAEKGKEKTEKAVGGNVRVGFTGKAVGGNVRVGFCELPGSRKVFNLSGRVWDRRTDDEDTAVPLLGIAGRLGVVNKKSAHVDAAFQLMLWLSDARMSEQVSSASSSTTLFRQSNLKSPGAWVEKQVPPTAAVQYSDATEAAMRHQQWLDGLRLPGRAEYLAALDDAVAAAVRGQKSSLDALLEADAKWRKITERLGVERQLAAYRHSLGLEK